MRKTFYFSLAAANVKRSREVYVPYFIVAAVISGVYFLILGMIFSPGLTNLPGGETAQTVFIMGICLFTVFAYLFMLYVNAFLVKRRKKEFGLYSVLGMNRRQVARVLMWENLVVIGAGTVAGILIGCVFGRLLFMLLMRMLHAAAGSTFRLPFVAFAGTFALLFAVFASASLYNGVRIRVTDTAELLRSDHAGEKRQRAVVPTAVLGALLLAGAYYVALTADEVSVAISFFFPAAMVVIIATFLLFSSGSTAFLRLLRRCKRIYYKPENFIAISSMLHRMRQNARGLAVICVFSTMLIVTVAGTSSLYLGQEEILRANYPYDVRMSLSPAEEGADLTEIVDFPAVDRELGELAAKYGVTLSASADKLVDEADAPEFNPGKIVRRKNSQFLQLQNAIVLDRMLMLDVGGDDAQAEAFADAFKIYMSHAYGDVAAPRMSAIYDARTEGYAVYGGLLFLGAFFGVLFLAVTVIMIYFKQITEGQEDKERFSILQKVGMRDIDVKRTIDRQILWVFFLPLIGALMHVLAASRMIAKMLEGFALYNTGLTLNCVLAASAVFALVYLLVYRQTAGVYYRMVRRQPERTE